jgi:hypothetical protein
MILAPRAALSGRALGAHRAFALWLGLWTLVTAAWISAPLAQGLRGEYFEGLESSGVAAHTVRDPEVSTAWISMRWWFVPPPAFTVRWTGYLVVERAGRYTFQTVADEQSQLRIGQQLVVDNPGGPAGNASIGVIDLDRGAYRVLLESHQRSGSCRLEWSWARDGRPLTPIPPRALSIGRREPWLVDVMGSLPWLWLATTLAAAVAGVRLAYRSARLSRISRRQGTRAGAAAVCVAALAGFYLIGATEHARRVNTSKARADQSGYLRDAQEVYANWHGQEPPGLVGQRNRMPLYAAYQALFWNPRMSNDAFFEIAKVWNIRLSLLLLVVLALAFSGHLPRLVATNLLLVVAFGIFIFKAGYTQAELLFYTLFFLAFLACCHLLRRRQTGAWVLLPLGAIAGIIAGLAHLTKAAALPLVIIFGVVCSGREIVLLIRRRSRSGGPDVADARAAARWRLAGGAAMLAAFIITLSPYIATNKRVFGQYFYNVNTTFYAWYDDWAGASVGTRLHGDDVGWPTLPPSDIPSMGRYLRTHTLPTIVDRVAGGAGDMVARSYQTFWYSKYVLLYGVFAGALIAANPQAAAAAVTRQWPVFVFLLLYAGTYLPAIAFYAPISGTGTARFLLAHVTPLLFTLSCFFARVPFRDTRWRVAGATITPAHFHLLVLLTIGFDLTFTLWPRLMTTYGGF